MIEMKPVKEEDLQKVTGGAGGEITGIIGMENYAVEQKRCPGCGGNKLVYRDFIADDGVTTKPGQLCECGYSWTVGNTKG